MRIPITALLILTAIPAAAQRTQQTYDFQANGFDKIMIASTTCTGFWRTPSFKCAPTNVPAYLAKAANDDNNALVIVSPGAGGLDRNS